MLLALGFALSLGGCQSGDGDDDGPSVEPAPVVKALVSDWRNLRLDLIDAGPLFGEQAAAVLKEDLVVDELDLSSYVHGPLNAEVSPDGRYALVSLSAGFFVVEGAGALVRAGEIPQGPGQVLVIDLNTLEIVAELETGNGPMGIVFADEGRRALVAHFASGNLAVVDLSGDVPSLLEDAGVDVGLYAEEMAVSESGKAGIVSYSAAGNVRTFDPRDPANTLSEPLERPGDAAGVAFFPGSQVAFVVQAPNALSGEAGGYDVVDVADPSNPVLLAGVRDDDAPIMYPAAPAEERGTVLVPISDDRELRLREYSLLVSGEVELVQEIPLGATHFFGAYGVVAKGARHALLSVPGDRLLMVVDLDTGAFERVTWGAAASDAGPMDVALIE